MRRSRAYSLIAILTVACLTAPADAQEAMVPQLRKLSVPADQAKEIATRLSLRFRDMPGVQISPDSRNEQLVVMAPEAVQIDIAREVQTMLASRRTLADAAPRLEPIRHTLTQITWREFEDDLQRLSDNPLPVTTSRNGERAAFTLTAAPLGGTTVEVDRRNNMVTVVAPKPTLPGWEKMIQVLDQVPTRPSDVTRLMRLDNAEPAPIQQAIRLLRDLEANPDQTVAAAPVAANSVFRNAVFQQPAGDAQVPPAAQADGDGGDGDGGDGEAMGEDGGAGVIGDTQIQFVPELGTIIIRGAKRDVQRVMDVIQQIEEQSELTKPDIEVAELKHADSNAVATLLQQLYEDVLSARQGEVSITSLDSPNALLLIGRTEAIKSLKELIEKIDQPVSASSRLRVFRLQNASAIDAEQSIRDFFSDRPGAGDDFRPGIGPRVRVLADYRTNSLIISAAPRDMEEVTRLINELDVQQIAAQNQIKIFQLNNALADDLAPVIQAAINGDGEGGNDNITAPSTSLSIVSVDPESNELLDSGILAGAVITADPGANSLVVRAPAVSMPLIGELIRQLDQAPGIESFVKVFTIENGDALQLTTALQDLFGDTASTSGTAVGAANLAGLPSLSSGPESSLVGLRFSTDQRTNSIIASGSAEDLEVVESILLRLDSTGFAERITEVIWLRHQGAADVATAIQTYVQQRTQTVNTIQQFQQGLGPFDLPDRDLIVVAEPVTNSLLLSVSPRMYEDVRRMIDRLDRRPPMVLIKVLIAEVGLDDGFEIGGEVGLQDSLVYDRGIAAGSFPGATDPSNPGFNFNNNGQPNVNSFGQESLAARGISSFGVGTTNSALGYGGFVLSAASDSVSLLLRTLQDANRLQILSRPQVMTVDNTEGLVQVGSQIARVTGVINNGVAGTQIVTEDIEVGLILRIRPRVGADGLIVMDVDATRSSRDDQNGTLVPTGDGDVVLINDILQTTAQSTIAAFSGQTVVFGGLIQKARTQFSRRIPYVSNIPILGYLFKYEQELESRNELLVILTPMLVTGEEDLEYIKQVESSRMSWCLADVVEAHGDVGLNGGYGLWGPAVGGTIYPDLQPTIDSVIVHDGPVMEGPVMDGPVMKGPVMDGSTMQGGRMQSSGTYNQSGAYNGGMFDSGSYPVDSFGPTEAPAIMLPEGSMPQGSMPQNFPSPVTPAPGPILPQANGIPPRGQSPPAGSNLPEPVSISQTSMTTPGSMPAAWPKAAGSNATGSNATGSNATWPPATNANQANWIDVMNSQSSRQSGTSATGSNPPAGSQSGRPRPTRIGSE